MGIAYASTLFAGGFAFGIVRFTFPRILESGALGSLASVRSFPAYFTLEIPPLMGITTALATAFIFGLAMVAFAIADAFLPWQKACGYSVVFYSLAFFAFLYFLTAAFLLPETKGRTLEELEKMWERKREV